MPGGLGVARQWLDDRRLGWERGLDRLGDLLQKRTVAVRMLVRGVRAFWFVLVVSMVCRASVDGPALRPEFEAEVDNRLEVPVGEQAAYAARLGKALEGRPLDAPQYVVLVDRSPKVQALLLSVVFAGEDV